MKAIIVRMIQHTYFWIIVFLVLSASAKDQRTVVWEDPGKVWGTKASIPDSTDLDNKNVTVVIEGVRSEKGKLILAVFKDQQGFKMRKPIKRIVLKKSELKEYEVSLHLDPGTYGITLLDDENLNHRMDYNFIGIPKEGFGFSNYYHTGLSKPHFDRFKFEIEANTLQLIEIQIRYVS